MWCCHQHIFSQMYVVRIKLQSKNSGFHRFENQGLRPCGLKVYEVWVSFSSYTEMKLQCFLAWEYFRDKSDLCTSYKYNSFLRQIKQNENTQQPHLPSSPLHSPPKSSRSWKSFVKKNLNWHIVHIHILIFKCTSWKYHESGKEIKVVLIL